MRAYHVTLNAFSAFVHLTKQELRPGMTLVSSLEQPKCRCLIVLHHAMAETIHRTKVRLTSGISLFGSPSVPNHRGDIITLRTALVEIANCILRFRISIICK